MTNAVTVAPGLPSEDTPRPSRLASLASAGGPSPCGRRGDLRKALLDGADPERLVETWKA
jgi:hypothetical protein